MGQATDAEGDELLRLRTRRKVFSDVDNQAISKVFVRPDTMLPVRSRFHHSVLGAYDAEYGDGKVSIRTAGTDGTREQELLGCLMRSTGWLLRESFSARELQHATMESSRTAGVRLDLLLYMLKQNSAALAWVAR